MFLYSAGENGRTARTYWHQASNFYIANKNVDFLAKPLTSYYCALNMAKALLQFDGQTMSSVYHGVSGRADGNSVNLANEVVEFKQNGVLPDLCAYFDEPRQNNEEYCVRDLLYNLPHIHRAFCMTQTTWEKNELFIPLMNCGYYRIGQQREIFFRGELSPNWTSGHTINKAPNAFEEDFHDEDVQAIRMRKRTTYTGNSDAVKIRALKRINKRIRKHIFPIFDAPGVWYLKRSEVDSSNLGYIKRSPIILSFAALHRLSELSRYDPKQLEAHFAKKYGWVLQEFLARTLDQLLDDFTTEITGREAL
ncbi:YaaC family protein [Palleronia sp. THAF1]|uniref:YaaC family protein n=1 Tax=Palleronia sp. THAF1 TaxID=2587842 RepID=UPI001561F19C|nr:YaaC family protein [Palleronia sp. THAF1]